MSKRISIEAKIVDYFRTEGIDKVRLVFGLVREEMRQRDASIVAKGARATLQTQAFPNVRKVAYNPAAAAFASPGQKQGDTMTAALALLEKRKKASEPPPETA